MKFKVGQIWAVNSTIDPEIIATKTARIIYISSDKSNLYPIETTIIDSSGVTTFTLDGYEYKDKTGRYLQYLIRDVQDSDSDLDPFDYFIKKMR